MIIYEYYQKRLNTGAFEDKRDKQKVAWMWQEIQEQLVSQLKNNEDIRNLAIQLESEVMEGRKTASEAAAQVLSKFQNLPGTKVN